MLIAITFRLHFHKIQKPSYLCLSAPPRIRVNSTDKFPICQHVIRIEAAHLLADRDRAQRNVCRLEKRLINAQFSFCGITKSFLHFKQMKQISWYSISTHNGISITMHGHIVGSQFALLLLSSLPSLMSSSEGVFEFDTHTHKKSFGFYNPS